MDQATHNKIVSFIWGIADDVLRDLFRRGKYLDVTYPLLCRHILVTVSQELKAEFAAGFNYTALVRFAERMIAERVVGLVGKWACPRAERQPKQGRQYVRSQISAVVSRTPKAMNRHSPRLSA